MNWASYAIDALRRGEVTRLRPHGHSMHGKIEDGDTVTVEPIGERALQAGDIVLVRVHGHVYLHLIKAVQGERLLIGNNRGGTNGWVGRGAVYGVATRVESSAL